MPLNEDSLWSDIFSFGYISLATLRISIWQRCDWSTSVYKLRSTWGSMAEARTLDRASCSLFGFFCLFYLHTARKESEPWGQVHQTCSRSAPDSLVSPASQPYTNTKESFQIAMFAKKLKLEKECTTGMFKTEGLGAIKWRNVCLRLAQFRHPSIVVKYCQIHPLEEGKIFFLVQHFTLVRMPSTKALDAGFLRLCVNYSHFLNHWLSHRHSFTQKYFLASWNLQRFCHFSEDLSILDFSPDILFLCVWIH